MSNEYTISLNNKDIWSFYEQNKHIDFESANLLLIKFLQSIYNAVSEDMDTNINSQLIAFIHENKAEMSMIKSSISSMNDNVSRINSDIVNAMTIQLMQLKKDYMDDVKQVVSNNMLTTCEKISMLVERNSTHLVDKTQLLLNDVIPKNHEQLNKQVQDCFGRFYTQISEDTSNMAKSLQPEKSLGDFITQFETKYNLMMQNLQQPLYTFFSASEERIQKNIDSMKEGTMQSMISKNKVMDDLGEFLGKYKGSHNKGKFGEQNLSGILNELYSSAEITNTSGTKASGDFIMRRHDKPTILFENKDYDYNIPKEEISKFIRDVDTQEMNGIFISQYSGISFKQNFQIDVNKGNVLVYIQQCEYSPEKIRVAVDIIDTLYERLLELDLDEDENTISKEVLDEINADFQTFIHQKDAMNIVIKDFQKKMATQIENLKFPALEKYLSQKYAYVKSNCLTCDICNLYTTTSKQSLSAHKRGCVKKTKSSVEAGASRLLAPPHQNTIIVNTHK